jgi:hypothetical protein
MHSCKEVYYRMHAKMQAACLIVASPWWLLPRSDKEFGERRILYIIYGKSGCMLVRMSERWLIDG